MDRAIWGCMLISFATVASGHISVAPENKAVLQGTTVILACLTNDTSEIIFWRRKTVKEELPEKISFGTTVSSVLSEYYRVNGSSSGQFDLVIINATLLTGNLYFCQEGHFGLKYGRFVSAELIVFESNPRCETDFISSGSDVIMLPVNRALRLRCTVQYAGNWEPTTEWKKQNSTAVIDIEVRRNVALTGAVALTTILIVSSNYTNGSRYIYELRFDKSRRPNISTAENVPDYYYTWLSPTILQADPDDTSPEGEADKRLWPYLIAFAAAVLLIAIIVTLAAKKRKNDERIALDIIKENEEAQNPENMAVVSSAQYASLQAIQQMNVEPEEPAYTQLRNVSSSQERDTRLTMEQENSSASQYANLYFKAIFSSSP